MRNLLFHISFCIQLLSRKRRLFGYILPRTVNYSIAQITTRGTFPSSIIPFSNMNDENCRNREAAQRTGLSTHRTYTADDSHKDVMNERNEYGETFLFSALKNMHGDEMVYGILAVECDVNITNIEGESPLHYAVTRVSSRITRRLISCGADLNAPNYIGNTPLHVAVWKSNLRNVMELLRHPKVTTNAKNTLGYTPLYMATQDGENYQTYRNYQIAIALLNSGGDINSHNGIAQRTILHSVLLENKIHFMHTLILRGADLNATDALGMTPLHYALRYNPDDIVYTLLYYGANGNQEEDERRRPLELAIRKGNMEIAEYLMLYTDSFNDRNSVGMTLLHLAIPCCPWLALQMLENGADVNLTFAGQDCVTLSLCDSVNSSRMFEEIWSRIDVTQMLENKFNNCVNLHAYSTILQTLLTNKSLPINQYLKCLYIILESPHIKEIIEDHITWSSDNFLFLHVFFRCNFVLSLDDKLKITYLFLYYDIKIYYEEVQVLYQYYGLDDYVELLLKQGIRYYHCKESYFHPMFCQIWYNHFHTYRAIFYNEEKLEYRRYFKVTFDSDLCNIITNKAYVVTEVPSLIQLSRDAVRNIVYKKWSVGSNFKVYQMFSELDIPPVIRDILYLRKPLYRT